ncbi:hypothetical protein D3C81_1226870 [compost metagenome]
MGSKQGKHKNRDGSALKNLTERLAFVTELNLPVPEQECRSTKSHYAAHRFSNDSRTYSRIESPQDAQQQHKHKYSRQPDPGNQMLPVNLGFRDVRVDRTVYRFIVTFCPWYLAFPF